MNLKNRYFERLLVYSKTCDWLYRNVKYVKNLTQAFLFKKKFEEIRFPKHKISSKNLLNLACLNNNVLYAYNKYKFEINNDIIKFLSNNKQYVIFNLFSVEKLTYQQIKILLESSSSEAIKNNLFHGIKLPIKQMIKLANANNIADSNLMKYPSYFKRLKSNLYLFNRIDCNNEHINWLFETNNFKILKSISLDNLSIKSLNKIWHYRDNINLSASKLNLLNKRLLQHEQKLQCKLF